MSEASFKERHRDFQYVCLELQTLRRHNDAVLRGASGRFHLFSMLALTFVALERFLRIVLADKASRTATLHALLEQATGHKQGLFVLEEREHALQFINGLRVGVMHGVLGGDREAEHLLGRLLLVSLDFFAFTDDVVAAFDAQTGAPREPRAVVCLRKSPPFRSPAIVTPDLEYRALREHNLAFRPGEAQDGLLLLAEGAMVFAMVEAACRAAADESHSVEDLNFSELMHVAVLGEPKLLRIPFEDEPDGVRRLCSVRDSLVHANFEQAAREAGCADVVDYFGSQYAPEIERAFEVYDSFRGQLAARGRAAT